MKRISQAGQAMAELLIGIIAMIAILIGIITFGEGGYHWLSTMNEAAALAWIQAVSPNSASLAQTTVQPFLRTWDNADGSSRRMQELGLGLLPDGTGVLQYNFHDTQVTGSRTVFNSTAREVMSQPIAGNPNYIDYLNYTQPYLRSQPVFSRAVGETGTSGWIMQSSTHRFALGRIDRGYDTPVDFGNGFQRLFYNRDWVDMQSFVFLPPLSGLQ